MSNVGKMSNVETLRELTAEELNIVAGGKGSIFEGIGDIVKSNGSLQKIGEGILDIAGKS